MTLWRPLPGSDLPPVNTRVLVVTSPKNRVAVAQIVTDWQGTFSDEPEWYFDSEAILSIGSPMVLAWTDLPTYAGEGK